MKIGVVIVTYNRLDKLKLALESYEKQVLKPKYILVVNNNSTDGTYDFLEKWKEDRSEIEKRVVNLAQNTGGSGGFYEGLKHSLELDADWIWVADDDAYTKENALSKPTVSTKSTVSRKSSSVSPGNPTMMSVVSATSGMDSRMCFTISK